MPGFCSSLSNNIDCVFGHNADFSGNPDPNDTNGIQTDGQLWIGRTALNAGGTHIDVNTLTAGSGISITNGPGTITIASTGVPSTDTITGDSGPALTPNWSILGQQAGTVPVMDTIGTATSTLRIEDRTWQTQIVVDPSAAVGLRGTFQTITAALAAASSGQTIFVRPGTYTENFTLKAGVNITGWPSDGTSDTFRQSQSTYNVKIIGKMSFSAAGNCVLSNLFFQTNSDNILALSGSNSSHVLFKECYIYASNNTAVAASGTNTEAVFYNCSGDLGTTGIAYFALSGGGNIVFDGGTWANSGNSVTANTSSAGSFTIRFCEWASPITTSGTTAVFNIYSIFYNYDASNTTFLTHGSTSASASSIWDSLLQSGTASTISVSASASLRIFNCQISSTNTNAITGAGTLNWGELTYTSTSGTPSNVINTTTQQHFVTSPDRVRVTSPGSYPYTTLANDYVILVDTSAARTITPLASPQTGQTYRIKDSVGSAAANNITVTPSGKNIDGAASKTINANYGSIDIVYNGTEWSIL